MRHTLIAFIILSFILTSFGSLPISHADDFVLPKPGEMVGLSLVANPSVLKGMEIHPENPLKFDFIMDTGDSDVSVGNRHAYSLQEESTKLIKYFLASLTTPEQDLWVNLSPYEKERIIPDAFSKTDMGRDVLAEDYLLKQIISSLIFPNKEPGKEFWKRIYKKSYEQFGKTDMPVDTFHKVWIVPSKIRLYEDASRVIILESHLKVMLEKDYLAMAHSQKTSTVSQGSSHSAFKQKADEISTELIKEIIIPELEKEVNQGEHFAPLRQIFNSLILASWYKRHLKDGLLGQLYINQNKLEGIETADQNAKEEIYKRYLQALRKGVFNFIKEDTDQATGKPLPRKYFSGGILFGAAPGKFGNLNEAMVTTRDRVQAISYLQGIAQRLKNIAVTFKPRAFSKNSLSRTLAGLMALSTTTGVNSAIQGAGTPTTASVLVATPVPSSSLKGPFEVLQSMDFSTSKGERLSFESMEGSKGESGYVSTPSLQTAGARKGTFIIFSPENTALKGQFFVQFKFEDDAARIGGLKQHYVFLFSEGFVIPIAESDQMLGDFTSNPNAWTDLANLINSPPSDSPQLKAKLGALSTALRDSIPNFFLTFEQTSKGVRIIQGVASLPYQPTIQVQLPSANLVLSMMRQEGERVLKEQFDSQDTLTLANLRQREVANLPKGMRVYTAEDKNSELVVWTLVENDVKPFLTGVMKKTDRLDIFNMIVVNLTNSTDPFSDLNYSEAVKQGAISKEMQVSLLNGILTIYQADPVRFFNLLSYYLARPFQDALSSPNMSIAQTEKIFDRLQKIFPFPEKMTVFYINCLAYLEHSSDEQIRNSYRLLNHFAAILENLDPNDPLKSDTFYSLGFLYLHIPLRPNDPLVLYRDPSRFFKLVQGYADSPNTTPEGLARMLRESIQLVYSLDNELERNKAASLLHTAFKRLIKENIANVSFYEDFVNEYYFPSLDDDLKSSVIHKMARELWDSLSSLQIQDDKLLNIFIGASFLSLPVEAQIEIRSVLNQIFPLLLLDLKHILPEEFKTGALNDYTLPFNYTQRLKQVIRVAKIIGQKDALLPIIEQVNLWMPDDSKGDHPGLFFKGENLQQYQDRITWLKDLWVKQGIFIVDIEGTIRDHGLRGAVDLYFNQFGEFIEKDNHILEFPTYQRPGAAGDADLSGKTRIFNVVITGGSLLDTLAHEAGHHLGFLAPSFIRFWRSINLGESNTADLKDFLTNYAKTNTYEDEAESNEFWSNRNREYFNKSILFALRDGRTKMLARYLFNLENYAKVSDNGIKFVQRHNLQSFLDETRKVKYTYAPDRSIRLQRINSGDVRYPPGRIGEITDGTYVYQIKWDLQKGSIIGVDVKDKDGNLVNEEIIAALARDVRVASFDSKHSMPEINDHHSIESGLIVREAVQFLLRQPGATVEEIFNNLLRYGSISNTQETLKYIGNIKKAVEILDRKMIDKAVDEFSRFLEKQNLPEPTENNSRRDVANKASLTKTKGGVDLNLELADTSIEKHNGGARFSFSPEQLQDVDLKGLDPIITGIQSFSMDQIQK